jgi:hypothetical protein
VGGLRIVGTFLIGHRQVQGRLVEAFAQMLVAAELGLKPILFFEQSLRGFGPIPETGLSRFFEQFFLAGG